MENNYGRRPATEIAMLEREEGRIAYEDSGGPGPLVVCAPGMGALRSVYRFVAPSLAKEGYRVITMDLRGIGDSSVRWSDYSESAIASDLVALVEHVRGGPATLIGNSISAGAAVCAAAERPQLVAGLVLVGPFVRQVRISPLKLFLFRLALARPWGAGAWVNYQSRSLYPSKKPSDLDDYNARLRSNLREPGRMRAFQRMAATNHLAAESFLRQVRVPSLVVMGGRDPDFPDPRSEAAGIAELLHGRATVLEGLGHYPQAEDPAAFLEAVSGFLRSETHAA
jgi:pimeloyl-ACP methyl ester carboxylesterase